MVDIQKLRSRIVLKGYTQKSLVPEINARGIKISENTFSAKMTGASSFDCDLVDVLCDILEVEEPTEKADIFLAQPSQKRDRKE
jgi:hypothetical protein